jgi:hypothetical protein
MEGALAGGFATADLQHPRGTTPHNMKRSVTRAYRTIIAAATSTSAPRPSRILIPPICTRKVSRIWSTVGPLVTSLLRLTSLFASRIESACPPVARQSVSDRRDHNVPGPGVESDAPGGSALANEIVRKESAQDGPFHHRFALDCLKTSVQQKNPRPDPSAQAGVSQLGAWARYRKGCIAMSSSAARSSG